MRLLVALLSLLPVLGCLAELDEPGAPSTAEHVVIYKPDDLYIGGWDTNDDSGFREPNIPSLPLVDSLKAEGMFFVFARSTPQCSPSYCELMTGTDNGNSWCNILVGTAAPQEAWLADEVRRVDPGASTAYFGKPGWGSYGAFCTTGREECLVDSDCGGSDTCDTQSFCDESLIECVDDADCTGGSDTCDLTGHPAERLQTGFQTLKGGYRQNESVLDWSKVEGTETATNTFTATYTENVASYRDDVHVADFDAWWGATTGRKFAVVGMGNPHAPGHVPPGKNCTPGGAPDDCYDDMIEQVLQDNLLDVVTTIGAEMDQTCLIVFPDNGSEADEVTQAQGGKFSVLEGGIRVGALFSRGCLADASLRGTVDTTNEIMLKDVNRFASSIFANGYDPTLIMSDVTGDNRMNGQTRIETRLDLFGLTTGSCVEENCHGSGARLSYYFDRGVEGIDTAETVLARDGYKLVYDWGNDLAIELVYDVSDETIDLCSGDCSANLVGDAAVAYSLMVADKVTIESNRQSSQVDLMFGAVGASPTQDAPFDWRFATKLPPDEAPPTTMVCDVDFDDGSGEQHFALHIQSYASSSWYDYPVIYTVPGNITVAGSCYDAADSTNILIVDYDDTVAAP